MAHFVKLKGYSSNNYGVTSHSVTIYADTAADIPEPQENWETGSELIVVENGGKKYILNNARTWVEVPNFTGAGSSSPAEPVEQNVEWAETDEDFACRNENFYYWIKQLVVPEGITELVGGALTSMPNLEKLILPSTLRIMGSAACSSNKKLTEVIFKDGLEILPHSGLAGNNALISVKLPRTLKQIQDAAFSGDSALADIDIPDSVTALGNGVFGGCSALEDVVLPDSIESMGADVFGGCSSLKSVVLPSGLKATPQSIFLACPEGIKIYVPWAEDDTRNANAPWGATNATIHYNYTG